MAFSNSIVVHDEQKDDAVRGGLVDSAIDAMEKYTGVERGYRRAHARGLVCGGSFLATPAACELSKAEHFQGDVVPVQVRLSNAAGSPHASDHAAKVLGLAVRFQLPSGRVASWAAANLPSFVARTPEDFVRITTALKPALFGKPNPFKILWYLLARPSAFGAVKAIATMRPAPSFAHVRFNGVHTYYLNAPRGARQPFRYYWEPQAGRAALTCTAKRALPAQYLLTELRSRLSGMPIKWHLVFRFPTSADPLDDATRRWPDDRRTIVAGTLTVDRIEEDQRALETLVFDPTGVVPGIELSSDPLLRFRADVYAASHRLRTRETRTSAAPADLGQ
jgi:catalase